MNSLVLLLVFGGLVLTGGAALSQEDSLSTLQEKRLEYENKIKELQGQEKTLKNEISYMDSRINLTVARIAEAQALIKNKEEELIRLGRDLESLGGRIEIISQTFEKQKKALAGRAGASYKINFRQNLGLGAGPVWGMFLGAYDWPELISQVKYLKVVQSEDNRFLRRLAETKAVFQNQKVILDDKKAQVEALKKQIEHQREQLTKYQETLETQRVEKKDLLALTFNDETKYQQLLTQILAEIESVARSLKGGIKIGDVKRGELIAREGNTGCVLPAPTSGNSLAGAHLHFGVYKDGVALDPQSYLDRGDLAWPESPTTVTQNFGANYDFYMRNFGVPGHNAIDMSQGYGAPILAAADGTAYETGDSKQYASWCNGKAKGIRLEHANGLMTIYWHVL